MKQAKSRAVALPIGVNSYVIPDEVAKEPKRRSFHWKKILKRVVLIILVLVVATGGYLGYTLYKNAAKLTGDNNPLSVFSSFIPSTLAETNGRVNILLAGYSADDAGHQGATLTDSIMIVSINPSTKQATLISVPRDLYVHIPGFGYSKINAAYEDGESEHFSQASYFSGGMGLLQKTLTQDFGVQFNYQALLDYTAFRDAVNAVGGITITINSPDPRGLYDPYTHLQLPNGTVTLNGQQALNLARARGDGPGAYGFPDADFDRTEHQQQMLIALKTKAASGSNISNPLRIAQLVNAVGKNLQTNLTLGDMETIYSDVKGLNNKNITSVTLNNYDGQDLLTDYYTPDGEDALIPSGGFDDYSQIQSAMQTMIGATPTASGSNTGSATAN